MFMCWVYVRLPHVFSAISAVTIHPCKVVQHAWRQAWFLINGTTSGDHFKKNSWFELVRSTRSSSTRSTTTTKRRRQWSPDSVSRHDNGEEEGCVFHPTRIGHLDVLVRRGNMFLRGGATPLQLQKRGSIAARVTRQFKCSPLRSQCDNRENCLNGSLLLKGRRTLGINLKWNVKKKKLF